MISVTYFLLIINDTPGSKTIQLSAPTGAPPPYQPTDPPYTAPNQAGYPPNTAPNQAGYPPNTAPNQAAYSTQHCTQPSWVSAHQHST